MSAKNGPYRDPVVEAVRAIRKRLWKAAGNDVARFIEQMDQEIPRRTRTTTKKPRRIVAPRLKR